jgi:3-oxoacyl-[acyl-carrier-protein] synthase II
LSQHEVCITGYGLLSALPEDSEQLWQTLQNFSDDHSTVNTHDFAPYVYHPLINYPVEEQILKHSDRRVMGSVMKSAVYTAGIALDQSQLKNQPDLLKDTQIIVAVRGGERDEVADQAIIEACHAFGACDETLNASLMDQLRPTLFLRQLPNLLAANIALLYGITGSSLTFMGGEIAGAQAIQLACARIQSGQAQRVLVGGVSINQTQDMMQAFAHAKKLVTSEFTSVWQRTEDDLCLGSASGFLILESKQSAQARNVPVLGKLSHARVQKELMSFPTQALGILSMTHHLTVARALQQQYPDSLLRMAASVVGTIFEAAMPLGIILALQCIQRKKLFSPLEQAGFEKPQHLDQNLSQLWVHCSGLTSGHAQICVESV